MTVHSQFTRYALLVSALLALITSLLQPPLATAAISERRFGAVDTFDNPQAATQLGAGWTRVRFPWADIQPSDSGQWNTSFFTDEQLNRELAAGREVVGLIVNTPPWALKDSNVPGVPSGLYLREDDPNNLWATFVRRIVSQYAGRINHWIIWNEPDIWQPSYPGRTWGSDEKDFLQLLRVAYNVIKQTNPNAMVHLSAFTYYWDVNYGRTPFFKRLLDEMQKDRAAAEHNYYFDVASANLYFRPDNVYDLIAWHHQQMREHGFDKPLWLTETNAAPSTDPAWPVPNPTFPITLDEQAHFIIQSMAMALAAGASRVAVYKMADMPADRTANPEPFGLVRDDGSRRPAFSAFQVGASYLAGFTEAALTERNDLYAFVTVKRGDSGWTTVAWTRQPAPQKISVPAHANQAALIDWNGHRQTISAQGGKYEIEIAGATCTGGCIIGGAPRLIVEGSVATAKINAPSNSSANTAAVTATNTAVSSAAGATAGATVTGVSTITMTPKSTRLVTATPSRTTSATATVTATATRTATSTSTATPRPTTAIAAASATAPDLVSQNLAADDGVTTSEALTRSLALTMSQALTMGQALTSPAPQTTLTDSNMFPLLLVGGLGLAVAAIALYVIPKTVKRS